MNKQFYELTNPQKSIWYTEKFFENTPINNICGVLKINQTVNFVALEKALNLFVKNNDSFRIKLTIKNDVPVQYVEQFQSFSIPLDLIDTDNSLKIIEKKLSLEVFQLLDSPLFKFRMFKYSDGTGGFMALMHHLISDAWSSGLVINEVMNMYTSLINNSDIIDTKNNSYIDYIFSEKEYLSSEKYIKDEQYWLEQFSSIPEAASIPSFKNSDSSQCIRKEFIFDSHLLESIQNYCKNYNLSIYNFLMSIFSIYIGKCSGLNEFVIGTPILNRSNYKEKHTAGMFISTVPFKVELNSDMDFISFSKAISSQSFSMLKHQKYPYEHLLENLRKQYSSLPSLYDIIISYQNMRSNTKNSDIDFSSYWLPTNHISTSINIHFFDINDSGKLYVAYDYRTSRYDESDVVLLHDRIIHLINQVLNNPNLSLNKFNIITDSEKDLILNEFNNTFSNYPRNSNIVQLFEEQVEKSPNNIATFLDNELLTYAELNSKANALANLLIRSGVLKGDIVAILLDKSVEMIIAILAILKAGAAYLPIDTYYPKERIEYIFKDSKSKLCISSSNFVNTSTSYSCNMLYIDTVDLSKNVKNLNNSIMPTDLAYVMYTSGSTGNPKGVMINHRNVVRLVKNTNFINFKTSERILQTGSIVFDACTFEIWAALLNGYELFIIKKEDLLNPDVLENYIVKNKISIMWLTSPLFNQLSEKKPTMFKTLNYLLTGGDVLSPKHINKVLDTCPNLSIINGYGPTENTTFSTCFLIDKKYTKSIPIGKPIANSTCYVLTPNLSLAPIGVAGELAVGGDGVGLGYLNNENLTKEKFISNPFGSDILYKTGDLVRWLPDGNIEFIGRIDNQVKIRGFRIELGEINLTLSSYPSIKDCTTVVHTINGEKTICAYFVANKKVSISDLRAYLKYTLPNYMVPSHFVQLENLPINTNGKIDRKLLPLPNDLNIDKEIIPPRNEIDNTLISILKDLLHINVISISDSFFDLGGDSLSAINLCAKIDNDLHVKTTIKDIMNNPIISNLSDVISQKNVTTESTIPKITKIADYYPASSAQKRIYYSSNIAGKNSVLYNIAGGLIFNNKIDIKKLEQCFCSLVQRHESLRTYFDIVDGNVVQKILTDVDFKLNLILSNTNNIDDIFYDFVKPFDLSTAPLFNAAVYCLPNGKYLLLINLHHSICDGTSLNILTTELCNLYNDVPLSSITLTYKDFSVWENKKIKNNEFIKSEHFWLEQFNDNIPLLNLPTQHIRPSFQCFDGNKIYNCFTESSTQKIISVCKKLNITPYIFFLSAYYILLSKYSGQDDIVIGSPIVGRENEELSQIVGMFVNTLALRNTIDINSTIKDFLLKTRKHCIQCFEHQLYPFDELVKSLNLSRDTSRSPLFDVFFTFQNNGNPNFSFENNAEFYMPDSKISKFDLSLEIIPDNNQFNYSFEYCTKLFDSWFIENLSFHYKNIVDFMLDNIEEKISLIDMLSTKEKNTILDVFNNTSLSFPSQSSIISIFEQLAEKFPNHTAIIYKDKKVTYHELNCMANQFANYLISIGLNNQEIVGVNLYRDINFVISMLGILKANGIYLPISKDYPDDRVDYILQNSKAKFLITDLENINKNNHCSNIIVDNIDYNDFSADNLNLSVAPNDTLYIIYTSGSTGKPKGVEISNKNLNNCIHAFINSFGSVTNNDICLASTNISFDVSIWELFFTLLNGATLCLYEENTITDIFNYCNYLIKYKITLAYIPPNILEEIYEVLCTYNEFYLQHILIGVEPIKFKTMYKYMQLNPSLTIINGYGPTETTICATLYPVTLLNTSDIIPIGRPLANNNILILDKSLHLVPIGVVGEIYILGNNVSKGYLNNSTLTSQNFIKLSNFNNETAYKTGDLGRWDENGNIHFVGRQDNQIKINGHRLELGEIEYTVSTYPHINKCVILFKESQLYAYFTSDDIINISDLRSFLQSKLPSFFVPNFLTQINNFKLTVNGKIDKKYLETIEVQKVQKHVPPENDFQKTLLDLWIQFLGVSEIGIEDNFFELGGDSLIAIKLQIEAFKLGLDISYADMFEYPTIKQLSEKMSIKSKPSTNENYDYSQINKLLSCNSINCKETIKKTNNVTNILLTGATGFVGSHILDYLINHTDVNVYCLIRKKNGIDSTERLLNVLNFYFKDKYLNLLNSRVFVVNGDITKPNFGLSDKDSCSLGKNISHIINSAAIVKHYGDSQLFDETNINGVKNLINFCEKFSIKLIHISTTSVSGNMFTSENSHTCFSEKNLYINQDLSNIYIYTKFIAERTILEHIINNQLNAQIIRLGNITNRFSDGVFQINISENAFANRLKAFISLGKFPVDYINEHVEFTPVDLCSEAIVKLALNENNTYDTVYHIFNNNYILIKDLFKYLITLNIPLELVSSDDFNILIENISKDSAQNNVLSGIITDFDNNKLIYKQDLEISNSFTNEILKKHHFEWPQINKDYINKYILYLKSIKFI